MDYKQKYITYKKKYLDLKKILEKKSKGGNKDQPPIIGISGISGAGKSTVAKILAKRYNGLYVDQDWFYKKKKPMITLSNGMNRPNWDHPDALDHKKMNNTLKYKKKYGKPIFLAGFALRDEFFDEDNKLAYHIHLKIPKELSLKTRLQVKKFKDKEEEVQRLMFEEAVFPFYEESLKKSTIDKFINVMDPPDSLNPEDRVDIEEEVKEIYESIKHLL